MRIMLVEDDLILADGLTRVLRAEGLIVDAFTTAAAANAALERESFNLLLLDIGLPDVSGFDVLRQLRERGNDMPVLLLTARDGLSDRVRGFELGADDYVIKPFAVPELLARVRALLRRGQSSGKKLMHGPLVMDLEARRIWLSGAPVEVSVREWAVLEHLLRNVDKVISKQQLSEAVLGPEANPSSNAVEVYISRLRSKLGAAGVHIRTVHGFGYLIDSRKS